MPEPAFEPIAIIGMAAIMPDAPTADQFWAIGIATPVNGYGIVKNNFHNVPKTMFGSWLYPNPGPAAPEQFYQTKT